MKRRVIPPSDSVLTDYSSDYETIAEEIASLETTKKEFEEMAAFMEKNISSLRGKLNSLLEDRNQLHLFPPGEVFVARLAGRNIFDDIKRKLHKSTYVACGECGAVTVEAPELARAVHLLKGEDISDDEDPSRESLRDLYGEIFSDIVDESREVEQTDDWPEGTEKSTAGLCTFEDPSNGKVAVALNYEKILLFHDPDCGCFNRMKSQSAWTEFHVDLQID